MLLILSRRGGENSKCRYISFFVMVTLIYCHTNCPLFVNKVPTNCMHTDLANLLCIISSLKKQFLDSLCTRQIKTYTVTFKLDRTSYNEKLACALFFHNWACLGGVALLSAFSCIKTVEDGKTLGRWQVCLQRHSLVLQRSQRRSGLLAKFG